MFFLRYFFACKKSVPLYIYFVKKTNNFLNQFRMFNVTRNIYHLTYLVQESLFAILEISVYQEYYRSLWLVDRLRYDLHNLADMCLTKDCSRNNRIINLIEKIGAFPYHVSNYKFKNKIICNFFKERRCYLSEEERNELMCIFDTLIDTMFS